MIAEMECRQVAAWACPYLDRALPNEQAAAFEAHLRTCANCKSEVERILRVRGLLAGALDAPPAKPAFAGASAARRGLAVAWPMAGTPGSEEAPVAASQALAQRLGAAPWWGISVALHVLVILLLGLITMTIGQPVDGDTVIVLTSLERRPDLAKLEEARRTPPEKRDVFASPVDVPATDLSSQVHSNIVVPPDILAQAELGDHFETINLDRPDTHSAFGNPDARMFHSVSGNDEPEGGGGMGGNSLLNDLIGVGGAASPGTGGGWGGGNGTGVGLGDGSGRGSFGARDGGGRKLLVLRHGGSKATESAVDLGLEWLAAHQDADGHWDTKKYGAGDRLVHGYAHYPDTAMTALALLAFLGAGHTEKVGKYRDNVQRAVAWLIGKQQDNGCIFPPAERSSLGYTTAMATMALSEAAGMGRVKTTRAAAQKAVEYCAEIHQQGEGSEKGAWRYGPKQVPDLSNSGWFLMALKSAKVAGLGVNPASFEGMEKFLDQVSFEVPQAPGADTAYGPAFGYNYMADPNGGKARPWSGTGRQNSMGTLCRQFMGWEKEKLQASVEHLVKAGGTPHQWGDKTDMYYWYYGTLCVFQQGGDVWKRWNTDMKKVLLDNQRKNGDESGSWDAVGDFSGAWGRVGQTALGVMCLEVYYRYLPLYK